MTSSRNPELIPAHRRALILEHLRQRGAASINKLSEVVGASGSTIRRDIEYMEELGYLERAHGGALIQTSRRGSSLEPDSSVSAQFALAEKRAIGNAAAKMVIGGQSVFFDSSSTVFMAAEAIIARNIPITAVTNDLGIGRVLAASTKVSVIVTGGCIRPGSLTLIGEPGMDFIEKLKADIAFVGAYAISRDMITEASLETAAAKRAIIGAARRVVLLADSSKFRPAAFRQVCHATAIHELVTDVGVDKAEVAHLRELGLAVTVVSARPEPNGRA